MVTQPQEQKVAESRDEGWRVMPNRATAVMKPSGGTIIMRVSNDTPEFVMILSDGSERELKPGELQHWWDGN